MNNKGYPINIGGAIITTEIIELIKRMQSDKNENIDYYSQHLDKISEILFDMGRERDMTEPKADIFNLLDETHQLRKDIEKMRIP